jgi:uncharacterized protein YoxC
MSRQMFRTAVEEVPNQLENFAFLALGILAIVLAIFMAWVLYRVTRTLTAVEDLVVTTTEEMRETLPEVRESLGHVNDITAGVNVGLRTVGSGAAEASDRLRISLKGPANAAAAAAHGVKVGAATLWRSLLEGE